MILHIFCIYKRVPRSVDNYLGIINKNTGERSMNYFIIIDAVTLILGIYIIFVSLRMKKSGKIEKYLCG